MTPREKRRFIRSFLNAVRDGLLREVPKMPESWDGHDLRQLAADCFEWERSERSRSAAFVRRHRAERAQNEVRP